MRTAAGFQRQPVPAQRRCGAGTAQVLPGGSSFLGSPGSYSRLGLSSAWSAARGRLHGDRPVPEVASYLAAADAGLNAITWGSGSNVKLFEYLAARLPVISTEFGVRGSGLKPGRTICNTTRRTCAPQSSGFSGGTASTGARMRRMSGAASTQLRHSAAGFRSRHSLGGIPSRTYVIIFPKAASRSREAPETAVNTGCGSRLLDPSYPRYLER